MSNKAWLFLIYILIFFYFLQINFKAFYIKIMDLAKKLMALIEVMITVIDDVQLLMIFLINFLQYFARDEQI